MAIERFLEPEQIELGRRARAWASTHRLDEEEGADLEGRARRLARQLAAEGLMKHVAPERFGGAREAVQARDLCVIREQLAWASPLADTTFAVQALGCLAIALAGSEEQKARYLPPLAAGEELAAFALTEPEAGSDIAAIATRAVKRGREYILEGSKRFISNAGIAGTYVVFASTAPERKGSGLSAFIVEGRNPGLVCRGRTALISPHPIGALEFRGCIVPEAQRLGREGEGWDIAIRTLNVLRATVGAAAVGMAQRALDEALAYSRERRQFGRALADFQSIRFKIAEMATELEAARLLVYRAAYAADRGEESLPLLSAMAKLFATEAGQRIVDQALQIHGGVGLVVGNPLERLYRDIRALRIYEGTSEIQKLVIARHLLDKEGLYGF